ncbi:hypothetical protein V1292_004608 [Bradyrhizobium sp. AZCC 1719]
MPDARASRKRQIQVTPGLFGGGAAAGVPAVSIPYLAGQATPLLFKASHSVRRRDAADQVAREAGASNPDIKASPSPEAKCISVPVLFGGSCEWVPWEPAAETDLTAGPPTLILYYLS